MRVARHVGVTQGKQVQNHLTKHVRGEFKKHKNETNPDKIDRLREE